MNFTVKLMFPGDVLATCMSLGLHSGFGLVGTATADGADIRLPAAQHAAANTAANPFDITGSQKWVECRTWLVSHENWGSSLHHPKMLRADEHTTTGARSRSTFEQLSALDSCLTPWESSALALPRSMFWARRSCQ